MISNRGHPQVKSKMAIFCVTLFMDNLFIFYNIIDDRTFSATLVLNLGRPTRVGLWAADKLFCGPPSVKTDYKKLSKYG